MPSLLHNCCGKWWDYACKPVNNASVVLDIAPSYRLNSRPATVNCYCFTYKVWHTTNSVHFPYSHYSLDTRHGCERQYPGVFKRHIRREYCWKRQCWVVRQTSCRNGRRLWGQIQLSYFQWEWRFWNRRHNRADIHTEVPGPGEEWPLPGESHGHGPRNSASDWYSHSVGKIQPRPV